LKEKALDRTIWRARFGRGFEPVVRQTTKCMNEYERIYKLYPYLNILESSLITLIFLLLSLLFYESKSHYGGITFHFWFTHNSILIK
jgi:hypothetical protein